MPAPRQPSALSLSAWPGAAQHPSICPRLPGTRYGSSTGKAAVRAGAVQKCAAAPSMCPRAKEHGFREAWVHRAEVPQKGPRLERAGRAEDSWRRGSREQPGKDVQARVVRVRVCRQPSLGSRLPQTSGDRSDNVCISKHPSSWSEPSQKQTRSQRLPHHPQGDSPEDRSGLGP